MSSYFLGYIEVQTEKNGRWTLLRFGKDRTEPEGSAYVCQGYMRDLLGRHEIGERVLSKKDDTYKPKEIDDELKKFRAYRPAERYVVNDDLSDELTAKINVEWDPDKNEDSIWWGTRPWYKITLGELDEKFESEFDSAMKMLDNTYAQESKDKICSRLDKIEQAIGIVSKKPKKKDPEEELEDDDYEDRYDPQWRAEIIDTLKYDIGSLNEMIGFLNHLQDVGDYSNIRIIAAID